MPSFRPAGAAGRPLTGEKKWEDYSVRSRKRAPLSAFGTA